ncbi:hypothetical protein APHAL10511_005598 [Amanita phalloides]|nr:hypothetical protein APHAL10511_005598 [Amanita phalloides]
MSTFSAFRIAIISLLKRRTRLGLSRQQARSISATNLSFADHAPTKTRTKFNKNEFTAAQQKMVEEPTRKASGPVKDEEIGYRRVQITHDGRLSAPTTVARILSYIDRKGYYIQLVNHQPPIVKIVNKAEEFNRKRQEKEQAKLSKAKQAHKELQLSWVSGEADTAHKLEKAREDLAKGLRVDLVFAHKKGQRLVTEQEMQERVQTVVNSLADVGKEWKERRFQRRMAAVFLQGDEHPHPEDAPSAPEEAAKKKKSKFEITPIPKEIWDLFQ